MHTVFMAFISFVAYATGLVTVQRLCRKGPRGAVAPLETLLALAVVVNGVFLRRPHYSLKYVALCGLEMFTVGAAIGSAMLLKKRPAAAGTREYEEGQGDAGDLNLWKRWLNSSRAVVDYEFRLMLLACYLFIVGPFAIVFRSRRGKSAGNEAGSAWVPRSNASGLEAARRPF